MDTEQNTPDNLVQLEQPDELVLSADLHVLAEKHFPRMLIAYASQPHVVDLAAAANMAETLFELLAEKLEGKASVMWDVAFENAPTMISSFHKTVGGPSHMADYIYEMAEFTHKMYEQYI